jgi:hypothetical protein
MTIVAHVVDLKVQPPQHWEISDTALKFDVRGSRAPDLIATILYRASSSRDVCSSILVDLPSTAVMTANLANIVLLLLDELVSTQSQIAGATKRLRDSFHVLLACFGGCFGAAAAVASLGTRPSHVHRTGQACRSQCKIDSSKSKSAHRANWPALAIMRHVIVSSRW